MDAQEKFSILLVDDDTSVVRILCRMLSDFTPLRFATSGSVALRLAREATPDLILLDIDMPEISGFEVCKTLKHDPALKNIPVIFITGHSSAQLESKGFELGAADFINKPANASLVLARVRTHQRLKMLSDTMRSAVTMDFLTSAVTRRQMDKLVAQEWQRVQRTGSPMTLMLIDIIAFTAYNAAFGDAQGDACLRAVADAVRGAARRPTDTLGRWGGGRLALLLAETNAAGAHTIARRISQAFDTWEPEPDDSGCTPSGVRLAIGGAGLAAVGAVKMSDRVQLTELLGAAHQAVERVRFSAGHAVQLLELSNERAGVT